MTRKTKEKNAYDAQGNLINTYLKKLTKCKNLSELTQVGNEYHKKEKNLCSVELSQYHQDAINKRKEEFSEVSHQQKAKIERDAYHAQKKLLDTYIKKLKKCQTQGELTQVNNEYCNAENVSSVELSQYHQDDIDKRKEEFTEVSNQQKAIIEQLMPYEALLSQLSKKALNLKERKCDTASEKAISLRGELESLVIKYKCGKLEKQSFKNNSKEAINNARTELKQHRGSINRRLIPFLESILHVFNSLLICLHCKTKSDPSFFAKPSRLLSTDSVRKVLWPLNRNLDSLFPTPEGQNELKNTRRNAF